MREKLDSIEFESSVATDGLLHLPQEVREWIGRVPGTNVHVRLTTRALAE